MTSKLPGPGKGWQGGQYTPLSDHDIQQIHNASLMILANTGVEVSHQDALHLFQEAGAAVDGTRVRLPQSMIEDAVDRAPSSVLLAGRDPDHDLHLEEKKVYIGTGGAALQVLDLESGEIRPALLDDVADMARVVDALENIHFYLLPIYPTDIPEDRVEISKYYASLSNTTKHVQGGVYTVQGIREVIDMCQRIVGGEDALRERPLVSFITSWMVSPLSFAGDVTTLLMEICRQRIPVVLSSAPMAGSTAPVTLAGMLAQLNAEQLAGLALTQLTQPGCPVIIGPIPATSDLRTGKYLGGSIELGMTNAAITQLAHYYQLPIYNSAGMTDAKTPDIQAGVEKTQSVIQVALAGANFIHHAAGMLEDMSTIAYEQFVIDNDILGMAMRAVRGIQVSDETLALEVIDRVGPGNHFLADDHTYHHMRTEHYYPSGVIDRQDREGWTADGNLTARQRARTIARDLLSDHQPTPLDADVDEGIKDHFSGHLILPDSHQ